ncbi:hypothetical protein [Streptomyces pratensis]|uniref:hypothetical protein n=1 Tax=Streptomyces pratensis TaxID=1169025 RepID=UPI0019321A5D|nr:hypothetical protein [Streptomyces pratensis]
MFGVHGAGRRRGAAAVGKLKPYEYLTALRSGSTTLASRGEILGTQDIGGVPEDVTAARWKKFRAGQA